MVTPDANFPEHNQHERGDFATTRWSLVLAACKDDSTASARALNELCRLYWYPLYCYVRRRGNGPADAEDLIQSLFMRMQEKKWDLFVRADASKGRLRDFLKKSLHDHSVDERRRSGAAKRGGGITLIPLDTTDAESRYANEPADIDSPDKLYDRRWAMTVIQRAVDALGEPLRKQGKGELFDKLSPYLVSDVELDAPARRQLSAELGINEGALKVTLHRLKKRHAVLLRDEVARTVDAETEIDTELEALRHAIG